MPGSRYGASIRAKGDPAGPVSDIHAAATPVFTELIAAADVIIGETLMAKGLSG